MNNLDEQYENLYDFIKNLEILIQKNVFEDKRISLKELRDALEANFGYSDAAAPVYTPSISEATLAFKIFTCAEDN